MGKNGKILSEINRDRQTKESRTAVTEIHKNQNRKRNRVSRIDKRTANIRSVTRNIKKSGS